MKRPGVGAPGGEPEDIDCATHSIAAGASGQVPATAPPVLDPEGGAVTDHQPNLFGHAPGIGPYHEPLPVRATDPASSAEAARRHRRSGKLRGNSVAVLALVREHPGHTYRELWDLAAAQVRELLGTEVELMRRLGTLKARGAVAHWEQRTCKIKGTKMVTWIAL